MLKPVQRKLKEIRDALFFTRSRKGRRRRRS
jgi:hypothetical protein